MAESEFTSSKSISSAGIVISRAADTKFHKQVMWALNANRSNLITETSPMNYIKNVATTLLNDESGQDLIEYALVAALIGLGAVTAMSGLSTKIGSAFTSIGTTLTTNV
jgi:pilus assembly protein Flp/PilA